MACVLLLDELGRRQYLNRVHVCGHVFVAPDFRLRSVGDCLKYTPRHDGRVALALC